MNMDHLVFKNGDSIGSTEAESDNEFLNDCFVEIDGIDQIVNLSSPISLITGRTGVGKSAILEKVAKKKDNSIIIKPADLSLEYISNSSVILFFENASIPLERFYKALWQHIIILSLIRKKFAKDHIERPFTKLKNMINSITNSDPNKTKALKYLENWEGKFFSTSQENITEIIENIEKSLSTQFGTDIFSIDLSHRDNTQIKKELQQKALPKIVNDGHLSELNETTKILSNHVFKNEEVPYFVLIDSLDDDWADDKIKYKLIKALIECVKNLRGFANLKVILALRIDLLERVFRETTRAGFQRDKYDALTLKVRWTEEQLLELIERRVDKLCSKKYTKQSVRLAEIFTDGKIRGKNPGKYIISNTSSRPREAIRFVNFMIEGAVGKRRIDDGVVKAAEHKYSKGCVQSLWEEWHEYNANTKHYIEFLRERKSPFSIKKIPNEQIETLLLSQIMYQNYEFDPIMKKYFESSSSAVSSKKNISLDKAKKEIFCYLYRIGAVGIKTAPNIPRQWSHIDDPVIELNELREKATAEVQRSLFSALNIKEDKRQN